MFSLDNFIDGRALPALANSVRLMFESIATQAQTAWHTQHTSDGSHTDVTAALLSAPRHRHSGLYVAPLIDAAASSYRVTGGGPQRSPIFNEVVIPEDVGIVLFQPDDSASVDPAVGGGGYDVGSLVLPRQARTGDVLFVGISPLSVNPVNLRHQFVNGRANHRFFMTTLVANPDAASVGRLFTFDGPGLLPLVYLEAPYAFNDPDANLGGWIFNYTLSARTSPL